MAPPFVLFGPAHLSVLLLVLVASAGLGPLVNRVPRLEPAARWLLIGLAVGAECVRQLDRVLGGDWLVTRDLPVHLCALCALLVPPLLLTKSRTLFQVLYCWSFAAPLQALITPDVVEGFPHIRFFRFMVTHGVPVVAVMYATFVDGHRPRWTSIPRTILATVAYAAVIAVVNSIVDGNYMFLRHKPEIESVFALMGPWPWYLIELLGFGVVVMAIVITPWEIAGRIGKKD